MVKITDTLEIPLDDLSFTFTRSGGPGGQNVNKVNSRVTLYFDLQNSPSLTEKQKARISDKLATRISKDGIFRVVAQKHRTQAANREEAIARFGDLLKNALIKAKPRRKTGIPKAVKEQRISEKRHQSRKKQDRTKPSLDD